MAQQGRRSGVSAETDERCSKSRRPVPVHESNLETSGKRFIELRIAQTWHSRRNEVLQPAPAGASSADPTKGEDAADSMDPTQAAVRRDEEEEPSYSCTTTRWVDLAKVSMQVLFDGAVPTGWTRGLYVETVPRGHRNCECFSSRRFKFCSPHNAASGPRPLQYLDARDPVETLAASQGCEVTTYSYVSARLES